MISCMPTTTTYDNKKQATSGLLRNFPRTARHSTTLPGRGSARRDIRIFETASIMCVKISSVYPRCVPHTPP